MLGPLFFIEEHYQDPQKIGNELAPLVAKLFMVPDRGVRSVLLNSVGFLTRALDKNALNASVFEPLCSGFNDSSPVLRELTLKATKVLVPSLNPPNVEKLSRYLVRLQSDAETSLRTSAVVFIAKIAPHLSEVSRQKMLLPAYSRSMKDPFAQCRLSALQSLHQSRTVFTKQDLATKVMPSIMPLLLDPMKDVREAAFRVVRELLEEIQLESNRMTKIGDPPVVGAPGTAAGTTTTTTQTPQQSMTAPAVAAPAAAAATANGTSSSGYLSGISSWMTTSAAATPAAAAPPPVASRAPATQPPVEQFAAASLNQSKPTPIVDDGWGDDDGDDGWGDDDDDNEDDNALAFSNIGGGGSVTPQTHRKPAPAPSMGGFGGMDDDPFASLGMKSVSSSATKPRVRAPKGKLVLPKKAPPAKKLSLNANEMSDGWDDF